MCFKNFNKRVQVLETDMRRNSTNVSKKSELSNDNDGTIETLTQVSNNNNYYK
jgi:hypothetical protein